MMNCSFFDNTVDMTTDQDKDATNNSIYQPPIQDYINDVTSCKPDTCIWSNYLNMMEVQIQLQNEEQDPIPC